MNEETLDQTEQNEQPTQPTPPAPPLLPLASPLDPAPLNALAETVAAAQSTASAALANTQTLEQTAAGHGSLIGALQTAVSGKADSATVTALQTAVSAKADAAATTAALAAKADASALSPITAALAALGSVPEGAHNLLVQYGSYRGAGRSGYANRNTLTFPFYPVAVCVMIRNGLYPEMWIIRGSAACYYHSSGLDGYCATIWSDNGVAWYTDEEADKQMNMGGCNYDYVALGYIP